MSLSTAKRILNATLALGIAASAFTVLPAATASAAPAKQNVEEGLTYNPNFDRASWEELRQAARKASANVPDLKTKINEEVVFDLKPYIKNADLYSVIVRGLPQGLKYDIDTRTITGSTPWEGTYDLTVSLRGRRDRHLQSFKLKVDNRLNPADYPRNTDDPNLNRQPHTRR